MSVEISPKNIYIDGGKACRFAPE